MILRFLPTFAAALLAASTVSAATQRCVGQAKSGAGAAVAAMDMEDGQMKSMILVLSRAPMAVPGHGDAAGADVHVQFDEKLTMGDTQVFDGFGVYLTFLNHAVKGPIDLLVTIGGIEAGIDELMPEADGTYLARLGKGPVKGNKLANAIDDATVARIKVVSSKAKDQILINADVPLGTVKEREDLGGAAMDDAAAKAKGKC